MYIASGLHLVVQPNPSEQTSHKPIENRPSSYSAWFDWHFASCKGIQDSLGFWIPHRGFRIPGTGFQYLSVELEIWIPILGRIPDSLSCILNSKAQDSTAKIARIPECGFLYMGRDIREFTQRRRRRQRQRKKAIGLAWFRQAKQQLCKCITPFVHLYVVVARLQRWNCLISRFVEDGNRRQQLSFPFPELWGSSLEFNSKQNFQHLAN